MGDGAVDGGVGPLCRGPDEKPEGFHKAYERAHQMPRDSSVHHTRVHRIRAHTKSCGQRTSNTVFKAFSN